MNLLHQGLTFHIPDQGTQNLLSPWEIVGMAAWLWTRSGLHRSWNLALFEHEVLQCVALGQFVMVTREGQPTAYLSWGHLNDEAEVSYIADPHSLRGRDIKSGEHLWLLNWAAPEGGTKEFTWVARHVLFHSSVGHMLRVKPNNHETARLVSARGIHVTAAAYVHEVRRVHGSYERALVLRKKRSARVDEPRQIMPP